MAIFRVYPEDLETFTVVAHPKRFYSSSSLGVTGSVYVFPRRSSVERESSVVSSYVDAAHDDSDVESVIESIRKSSRTVGYDLYGHLDSYMGTVAGQREADRNSRTKGITRSTPTVDYTTSTVKKLVVKDVLDRYYRVKYPSAHWGYTNYNCLSFFTASNLPNDAVLLYPNVYSSPTGSASGGQYVLTGAFTFDFFVNPRYVSSSPDSQFSAGTVLHLSSCYAVSIVSGSARDPNGRASKFRVLLQLSHSADVSPSLASPQSNWQNNLAFLSDDNSIDYNTWSHVVVRWGTDKLNYGTGSILIDSGSGFVNRGTFVVPSSTLAPAGFSYSGNPGVLCVGNYYEGSNRSTTAQGLFFAADPAQRDGLIELVATTGFDRPTSYWFRHPLNADLHDVSIVRKYVTDSELSSSYGQGPDDLDEHAFFLPPFFVRESPVRRYVGTQGGVLQSPFYAIDGSTTDPFNVALSFGVAGHDISLENFVKDLANDVDPRCLNLTGAMITTSTSAETANSFLWSMPSLVKRNMLVMPCDDGRYVPNWDLIELRSHNVVGQSQNELLVQDDGMSMSKFVDDCGTTDASWISLDNMVSQSSDLFYFDSTNVDSTTGEDSRTNRYADELVGPTPEVPGTAFGSALSAYDRRVSRALSAGTFKRSTTQGTAPYTVYQRTKDASSNEVVFFSVSNLMYGNRIYPGSLSVKDVSLSGSNGALRVTLRDDGYGNLYRSDCSGSAATWNSVGTVFYDEGLVVVKSPHLFQFGKHQFEFDFRGEQSVHVSAVTVVAPSNMLNSSSNPSFIPLSASSYPNDIDSEFVAISGINFHDENLNVVMRTKLAQPVVKRYGERFAFRNKICY